MNEQVSNLENNERPSDSLEHDKWEAEKIFRRREIEIKEREQDTKEAEVALKQQEHAASQWRNPLVVAIFAAAIAALGNAIVAFTSGAFQRQLEAQKSEQARILEMIKTGDPDKAAENLKFLLEAGLIADPDTGKRLADFLANRKPGSGPTLPPPSEAKSLINKLEYGDTKGLDSWIEKGSKLADEIGLKTKLGRTLLAAEVINIGPSRVRRVIDATSKALGGTPIQGIDEKKWIAEYLNEMPKMGGPSFLIKMIERRAQEFHRLIEKEDWDLQTYRPQPPSETVEGDAPEAACPSP